MDLHWLVAVRRALTIVGTAQPFAKRACVLLVRLFNIEFWRESERLRNEAEEIRNMEAYGKVVAQYARHMKTSGSTSLEVDALVAALLLARLRSYARARGIVSLRMPRTTKRRSATTVMPVAAGHAEVDVPPTLMERRKIERRAGSVVQGDDGRPQ